MEGKAVTLVLLACAVYTAYGQVNCTAPGRFADPSDSSCRNYTLCALNATSNTFVGYNYTCPTTSAFSPALSQCTTTYTCPNSTATTPSSACTAEGFIADANSTDCTSYIQCVDVNGVFSATVLPCPAGTFYDPTTTLCSSSYLCPFTCPTAGRFPSPGDTSCQQYYLCVLASNGTLFSYEYTCPTTSVFNPTTSLCTTAYTCPTS